LPLTQSCTTLQLVTSNYRCQLEVVVVATLSTTLEAESHLAVVVCRSVSHVASLYKIVCK